MAFFLAFETRFHRGATTVDGQLMYTDEFGTTRVVSDAAVQDHLTELEGQQFEGPDVPRKTYRQLISPWSGTTPNGGRVVLRAYIHMAEAFTSPGLVYALLVATIVRSSETVKKNSTKTNGSWDNEKGKAMLWCVDAFVAASHPERELVT